MSKDYCQQIASVLDDYRYKDRKNNILKIDIDKYHVEKWVEQFEDNHDIILHETLNLLNNYYFSKEEIKQYLIDICTSKKIFGHDIKKGINNTCFLNCQEKGNSQKRLFKKSVKIVEELYGIDISQHDYTCTSFLYLDDCMFSGMTVKKDVERLIGMIPNNSTIHLVFIAVHSFSEWWVKKSLEDILSNKNINLQIWWFKKFQNSWGKNYAYECLWPMQYQSNELNEYIKYIQNEINKKPEKKYRTFRTKEYTGGVFTSENNRNILEIELMKAGLKIRNFPQKVNNYMRPMGYDNRISFGFGAFFATYLNMSNNCPLAFWWGDANAPYYHPFSNWYPLLPRKSNDVGGYVFG